MKILKIVSAIIIVAGILSACQSSGNNSIPDIVPSTGKFSAAEETKYNERFQELLKVFASGGTAQYEDFDAVAGAKNYQPLPSANNNAFNSNALKQARQYAEENNSYALLVWHQGNLVDTNYFGDTNADSLITSLSLAKPVSVIAVGRAIAAGHIASLDTRASDFIIEWQGTDKEKITIAHLLSMSSGLLPQAIAREPEHVLNRSYLHPRHAEVIIHEYPLVDEPGSIYEYSNANGELIAPIIERATGKRYAEWVSEEIIKPLGAAGGKVWVNRPGGTAHSGCCILLPSETFLRLGLLYLNDGVWNGTRLLPEGFVKRITTPNPLNPQVGMGIYIGADYLERRGYANPDKIPDKYKILHSEPYLADDLVLFDGNRNQVVYIIPSKELVILRVGKAGLKDPEWDNSFLPNLLLRGLDPS